MESSRSYFQVWDLDADGAAQHSLLPYNICVGSCRAYAIFPIVPTTRNYNGDYFAVLLIQGLRGLCGISCGDAMKLKYFWHL